MVESRSLGKATKVLDAMLMTIAAGMAGSHLHCYVHGGYSIHMLVGA